MKILQTQTAPNPRRVRIFLAEKGITRRTDQRIDWVSNTTGDTRVERFRHGSLDGTGVTCRCGRVD
jgi:hypothetical protein